MGTSRNDSVPVVAKRQKLPRQATLASLSIVQWWSKTLTLLALLTCSSQPLKSVRQPYRGTISATDTSSSSMGALPSWPPGPLGLYCGRLRRTRGRGWPTRGIFSDLDNVSTRGNNTTWWLHLPNINCPVHESSIQVSLRAK